MPKSIEIAFLVTVKFATMGTPAELNRLRRRLIRFMEKNRVSWRKTDWTQISAEEITEARR